MAPPTQMLTHLRREEGSPGSQGPGGSREMRGQRTPLAQAFTEFGPVADADPCGLWRATEREDTAEHPPSRVGLCPRWGLLLLMAPELL